MSFDELQDQALEMLQRRGRASYRALKVQFNLDDELLDLLKEEITKVLRGALEQDGRMLVWTGEPGSASPSPPASPRLPTVYAPASLPLSTVDKAYRYARQGIIECQQYRCSTA